MAKKLNKAAILAVVIVAAIAAAALVYTYPSISPTGTPSPSRSVPPQYSSSTLSGSGSLSIYLTDAPPSSPTFKYLLINVSSVVLVYQGNVSTSPPRNQFVFRVPAGRGLNVNLTSLVGSKLLLGATSAPAGNVTDLIFNITGARAFFTDGSSAQLKVVADGKLMVHFQFQVKAGGSTNLTLDIQPNEIHYSQGSSAVLTPVIRVQAVQSLNGSTVTSETSVTETTTA